MAKVRYDLALADEALEQLRALRCLQAELNNLRERVEDLEDLRELNEAIARNASKNLVPWQKAKKELGLE